MVTGIVDLSPTIAIKSVFEIALALILFFAEVSAGSFIRFHVVHPVLANPLLIRGRIHPADLSLAPSCFKEAAKAIARRICVQGDKDQEEDEFHFHQETHRQKRRFA